MEVFESIGTVGCYVSRQWRVWLVSGPKCINSVGKQRAIFLRLSRSCLFDHNLGEIQWLVDTAMLVMFDLIVDSR